MSGEHAAEISVARFVARVSARLTHRRVQFVAELAPDTVAFFDSSPDRVLAGRDAYVWLRARGFEPFDGGRRVTRVTWRVLVWPYLGLAIAAANLALAACVARGTIATVVPWPVSALVGAHMLATSALDLRRRRRDRRRARTGGP